MTYRPLIVFAVASGAAVATGAVAMASVGSSAGSWLRNPIAWAVGLTLAALMARTKESPTVYKGVLAVASAGLAATLTSAPVDGVHRWIDVGPLHINMAGLLLPMAIVALARLDTRGISLAFAIFVGIVLAAQPDASQATAFFSAAAYLVVRKADVGLFAFPSVAAMAALAFLALLRPDPLQPVPEVEGIFGLMIGVSPILAMGGALALAAACLAPSIRVRPDSREAAFALTIYLAVICLAPIAGAFPVPLIGAGMSFPLGLWLGIGLLCNQPSGQSS